MTSADVAMSPVPDPLRSLARPAQVAGAGLVAALALHVRDPHLVGSWGPAGVGLCPFQAVTGLWCPGCGGLRAMSDLAHLDVVGAIGNNVLAVVLAVVLVVAWTSWVRGHLRGAPRRRMIVLGPRANAVVLAVMLSFTVVRNLPVGSALAP